MVYAAGILILSMYNDKIHVLLGKDHYNRFSDFGGKSEIIDNDNSLRTASREFYEETCGVVYSIPEIFNKLKYCDFISTKSYTNKEYFMYIAFIKYDKEIITNFNLVYNHIKDIPNTNKFKEKTELKWFLLEDVISLRIELRNIFHKTIQNHKNTILKVAYKYYSTYTTYNNGRS
jgi:hypothetical protein